MAATTAGTEVPAASHKDGAFPPFDSSTFAAQIIWLAIAFGLLYLLMSRIALPRIAGILDDRAAKIAADLEAARRARAESDAALAAYETSLVRARAKAQSIASETRQAVAAETDSVRHKLETELSAKLATAESQIEATKTAALGSVNGIAVEAASAIVEQLIGKAPDTHTVQAAVDAAVSN